MQNLYECVYYFMLLIISLPSTPIILSRRGGFLPYTQRRTGRLHNHRRGGVEDDVRRHVELAVYGGFYDAEGKFGHSDAGKEVGIC